MSTDETDDLLGLIGSLGKSEKRFFNQLASLGDSQLQQQYLALYQAMAAQLDPTQSDLPQPPAASATDRHQLRRQLYRSLRLQHSGKSTSAQLRQVHDECLVLFRKGLFHHCQKHLRTGLRKAEAMEHPQLCLEFLRLEMRLFFKLKPKNTAQRLEELLARENHWLAHYQLEMRMAQLWNRTYQFSQVAARAASAERDNQLRELEQDELLKLPANQLVPFTEILQGTIRGILGIMRRDFLAAEKALAHVAAMWQRHKAYIADEVDLCLICLNNYLNALLFSSQFSRFQEALTLLRQFSGTFPLQEYRFLDILYSQELLFRMNEGNLERAQPLLHKLEKWMPQQGQKLAPARRLHFCYNIAIFYFVNGRFSDARRWFNRVAQEPAPGQRVDLQEGARILNLVVSFELGDVGLIDSQISAAYRYFRGRRPLPRLQLELLGKLRDLAGLTPGAAQVAGCREIGALLEASKSLPRERRLVATQELELWAESRIRGVSLQSVFKEKVKEAWN